MVYRKPDPVLTTFRDAQYARMLAAEREVARLTEILESYKMQEASEIHRLMHSEVD